MTTATSSFRIRSGTSEQDVNVASALIGTSFRKLGVCEWLVPDPQQRAQVMTDDFRIMVAQAAEIGTIHLMEPDASADTGTGAVAVAIWFDATGPMPEPADYDARLRAATGTYYERFLHLDKEMEAHHPHQPHHYLALLAVADSHQGHGLGTALLNEYHAGLDRAGLPAYLEASNQDSARLYLRHGYSALGEPYEIGDGSGFIPLWREPAG